MSDKPEKPEKIMPADFASPADRAAAEAETAAAASPADGAAAPDVAALLERLDRAERAAAEARDAQIRAVAELDNVRKRAEREISERQKFGVEKLLGELLGVCDSLELGMRAAEGAQDVTKLVEGMKLTLKQLANVLEKQGVQAVDPSGQPFNPDLHEAMTVVPSADVPPNHVVSVMQKGYTLHGRLLRPAMVVVAKAPG